MENYILGILAVVSILDWISVAKSKKILEYLLKPAVMLVLLLYLYLTTHFTYPAIWFAFGICFSLLGDIFLMLPRKAFMAGLFFFLFAHVSYIGGFINFKPQFNLASGILILSISMASYVIYQLVTSHKEYFMNKKLKIPIVLYSVVISIMLIFACLSLTSDTWFFLPAFMVSLGAFSFYISDSIIAINRYVPGISISRVISMATYHIGQALLITGVVYQTRLLLSS